ncbi:MAG: SAM-dependent methyltransferase [Peptococcaceae bacterium]|jgi:tRNA (adenine22-N1)-methyltransferase|nr:SAM-dependent methyltransferase [Peptococcaceae bacterium]
MRIKLSNRLQAVARQIPAGLRVADVGTDHGYLPVYLVVNDIAPKVIASDRGKRPLDSARQLISLLSLENQIDVRLGDGLSVLQPDEAEVICLAGMGGVAIKEIISAGLPLAQVAKRLVLQPQRNVPAVRRFLVANGFKIVAEDLAEDDGFYYEIIAVEPGLMELTEQEADFGPLLLRDGHPLFKDFLILKETDLTQLLAAMADNNSKDSLQRKKQLEEEISRIGKLIGSL